MIENHKPKLLEYNVRFGDPECQVLMMRLMSDLLPALIASEDGVLKDFDLRWYDDTALTVVMASNGYPGSYQKGSIIKGIENFQNNKDITLFHAGTKFNEKNEKSALRADHLLILSNISNLLDKGNSSKTISRNISSLKGFYKYLISTNQISSNPTANIDAPKSGFFLPTTLTVEETQKILDAPIETKHIELRDKAMLYTLYATGMRISELVSLGIHNVNLTRGSVQVLSLIHI